MCSSSPCANGSVSGRGRNLKTLSPLVSLSRRHAPPPLSSLEAKPPLTSCPSHKRKALMKVVIVGGVAGGASCAARLRRLDENADILMVERGPYVSYANCGLPYHISGVIEDESKLLVASEETFRSIFKVDVRTNCEAVSISTA